MSTKKVRAQGNLYWPFEKNLQTTRIETLEHTLSKNITPDKLKKIQPREGLSTDK